MKILDYLSKTNMLILVIVMISVFFAMVIDLIAGLLKAKSRGELIQSQVLKRTINKFITYEGSIVIAYMVDVLIQISNILQFTNLNIFETIPLTSLLLGIFLLVVEFFSVKENADDKTRRREERTAKTLIKLLKSEEATQIVEKLKKVKDEDK